MKANPLSDDVEIPCTLAEAAQIEASAERMGVTVPEFCRGATQKFVEARRVVTVPRIPGFPFFKTE